MSGTDSTSPIVIRSFESSDLSTCHSIFAAGHRGYGHPEEYIGMTLAKDMADIDKSYMQVPNGHWWVAVSTDDNRIVGQVALLPLKQGSPEFYSVAPEDERDHMCELLRMGVVADAQRRGVGKQLVSHLIGYAREKGYRKVHLTTAKSMTQACAFYESFGFVKGPIQRVPLEKAIERAQQEGMAMDELDGYAEFQPGDPIPEEDQRLMKLTPFVSKMVYVQHFFFPL